DSDLPEDAFEGNGKHPSEYTALELETTILAVLAECPNGSCVKGDLWSPKQSDLTAKVCKALGIRTRGLPRRALGQAVFKAVESLAEKGSIEEYKAKNDRLRLKD